MSGYTEGENSNY